MQEQFGNVRDDMDEMRGRFDRLQSSVDGIAQSFDDHRADDAAVQSQRNRHEQWIQQLADKLGVKLSAE